MTSQSSAHPWLHIIGLGEEGLDSLSPASRRLLEQAKVIIGGKRHHELTQGLTGTRMAWPSPFDHLTAHLKELRGTPTAVLVTGDPLWFSAGEKIAAGFATEEILIHPQPSAFQWAAARMGWPVDGVECVTLHGRPVQQILPNLYDGARLICLTAGRKTPAEVAQLLTARGFGSSKLTVLGHLGGPRETQIGALARDWTHDVPQLNTLCIELHAEEYAHIYARSGLPDSAFTGDGTMTKQDIRAITLAKLAPQPRHMLWDLGCGCGSVAIEWMRSAKGARAIGIEPRPDRLSYAAQNAIALGVPGLDLREGRTPDALGGLPAPDAIFIGGGLTEETFKAAWAALKPRGRLVANGVTLESEARLLALHARMGGALTRIAIQRAEPVGRLTGWRAAMPVTQWSLTK